MIPSKKHFVALFTVFFVQAQTDTKLNFTNRIILESEKFKNKSFFFSSRNQFRIVYNNFFYINANLANLENQNGLYLPKGYGAYNNLFLGFFGSYFILTTEPVQEKKVEFYKDTPQKSGLFSVLNDTPTKVVNYNKITNFDNTGIVFKYKNSSISYGNWNQWIGSGIHNSLLLSNNSKGFYKFEFKTKFHLKNFLIQYKYLVSKGEKNKLQTKFYVSNQYLNINLKSLDIAYSRQILSGGNDDFVWSLKDASTVMFTNENMRYWDFYDVLFITYRPALEDLILFIELGSPNQPLISENFQFNNNSIASIIGLRKYGLFNKQNLFFGFEYARLVQGIYYNQKPTPNWYDNIKYDYSSYKNRRWGAHTGADSDDFLTFFGFANKSFTFIYAFNFERHGVTFNFPPEVKLENKISITYRKDLFRFNILYENEFFEHFAFINKNANVWDMTYEDGSVQRTKTLLFSINYTLF